MNDYQILKDSDQCLKLVTSKGVRPPYCSTQFGKGALCCDTRHTGLRIYFLVHTNIRYYKIMILQNYCLIYVIISGFN